MKSDKIAITAIARLENPYIEEWVNWHLNLGFDHIYIYDNSCGNEERIKLDNYKVTIIDAYDKNKYQQQAYTDSYNKYGPLYNYMAYIDIDEFIHLGKDKNIKELIKRFPDDLECYRMNWEIYGDNGLVSRNLSIPVQESFKKPSIKGKWLNSYTKSIVKTGFKDVKFISVHYPSLINGDNLITYDAQLNKLTDLKNINSEKSISINSCSYEYVKVKHYLTKTIDEYIKFKLNRSDAAREYTRNIERDFFAYNDKTKEKIDWYNLNHKEKRVIKSNETKKATGVNIKNKIEGEAGCEVFKGWRW